MRTENAKTRTESTFQSWLVLIWQQEKTKSKVREKKKNKNKEENLIGASNSLSFESLGEISSETEPPLVILNEPTSLPPSLKRFFRWVLWFHISEILTQVTLHLSLAFNSTFHFNSFSHTTRTKSVLERTKLFWSTFILLPLVEKWENICGDSKRLEFQEKKASSSSSSSIL